MELRHLRYFTAVAERLNFTSAAKFLGIKQPPLSVQIRKLEAEVGGALFHRGGKRIRLTPLGMVLLDEARSLLCRADLAEERLRDAAEGRSGTLRLAYASGAFSERITRRIRKFLRKNRGVRMEVFHTPREGEWLKRDFEADVLISEELALNSGAIPLQRSSLQIAVSPKHRLAEKAAIQLPDLLGEKLLLSSVLRRTAWEKHVAEQIHSQGLKIFLSDSSDAWSERFWLVSAGCGLTICTSSSRATLDAVRIPLLDSPEIITVATANPTSRSTALTLFLEAIRE